MKKIALSFCLVFVLISCSQKEESNLNVPDTSVVEEDKGEITFEDTTLNLKVTLTKKKRVFIYFENQYWERMAIKNASQKYPMTDKNGIALRLPKEEARKLLDKQATYYKEQHEASKKNIYAKYGISWDILVKIANEAMDVENDMLNTWDKTENNPFNDTSIYPSPF
jgi:uncharacterized lipoprotein YehR (DUF1307 family)